MSGELKTQGTQLYLLDNGVSPAEVKRITNLSNIDGIGGAASDIDVTNFDSTAREYLVGLVDNGQASFNFNLSPGSAVHQRLLAIRGGSRYSWAVGMSDGTAAPTIAAGDVFSLPTGRSWLTFDASVQEATFTFQTDDAVRVQGSLRVSGSITFTPKA